MTEPPRPNKGTELLPWCQRMWEYVRSNRPIAGAGMTSSRSSSGTTLSARPGTSQPGEARPLTLYISDAEDKKIGVRDGTVNAQHPTLGGIALDDDPAPVATISATTHFWIKCVGTFGSPDTYVITIETSASTTPPAAPAVSATSFTSCFYIGYVEIESGEITALVNEYEGGNLGVESFGSANLWWRR